ALARGGSSLVGLPKLFCWLALTALGAGALTAAALPPPRQAAPSRADPAEPDARAGQPRDRFGDPLPPGAVARLGTVAFPHGPVWGASLPSAPDGKPPVSAGGGWVRRWDARTGAAVVNLGDGWRGGMAGVQLVTADGRLARVVNTVLTPAGDTQEWLLKEHD